ncbi:GntR family transcriptional regulator [Streptococcus pluranimalium]|nr:GntR family transcriptional regulator [Streptococcus pluranimalium]MDY3041311.1 GntR family transcriptional regulator [Streptococcus pluranimalium]
MIGHIEPKYLQIAKEIRQSIREGFYPVNASLPDGKTLAKEFGVSLMTLKRALDMLVVEGYLIRRRGSGTFVRDWKSVQKPHVYTLNGATEDYGDKLDTEVLAFDVIRVDSQLAEKLSINEDDFAYKIIRLRYIDKKPSIIEYTYMPLDVIPHLKRDHLESSIYQYITDELGRKIHSAFVKVTGIRPDELEAEKMELKETDFLMQVEQVVSLDNCKVFEYSISRHLPEMFDFETVLFKQ